MSRTLSILVLFFVVGVGGCGEATNSQFDRPQTVVGTWKWMGNRELPSHYIFHEDGRVDGFIDGKTLADKGNWQVTDGHIIVTATTDDVLFSYRIDDDNSFTQIYWIDHGKKKLIDNDPPWVKVDSIED